MFAIDMHVSQANLSRTLHVNYPIVDEPCSLYGILAIDEDNVNVFSDVVRGKE